MQTPLETAPFAQLRPLDRKAVRWTDGFWQAKFEMIRDTSMGSVLEAIGDSANATYFGNFETAARGGGQFHGVHWSDGDCYKAMETMILLLDVAYDAALDQQIDEMVDAVAAAQESDGYINTQITLTDLGRWTDIHHHELYNFGHLFTAGVLHHQVTGKTGLLDVARKAADYLHRTFMPRDPEMAKFGFNPSQIMGLVEFYRETGDRSYLDLAQVFVENRGAHPDLPGNNGDQSQMRVPVLEETEAVGHAVTGPYLWAGAADIVMETNDQALMAAITRIWEDSTYRKMYITGGIGGLHKGIAERSEPRYEPIAEAYGRPYQLPNDTAYNETCANISKAMWSWRMLQLTGEARYADVMERVLLNSALSAVSLTGSHFTYSNPLRFNGDKHFLISNDSPRRWTRWRCYCCPPQVTRTFAGLHRWTYSASPEGLWVHLYGANTLTTGEGEDRFVLTQASDFPWSGEVTITVDAAPVAERTIYLRVPGWSGSAGLRVNGEAVETPGEGSRYVPVTRAWAAGDTIELSFDISPKIVVGRPDVEEIRNQAAVVCGPVVYCLEGEDLPDGVSIDEVVITPTTRLEPMAGEGTLSGVRVLDVELQTRPKWMSPELYAPLVPEQPGRVSTQLIPYFAWNNRDDNTMTVWLPLQGATD